MRHIGPPYGLGDLVGDSLLAMGLEQKVREQSSLLVWDEVVGERIAGAAQPTFARDGILFVTAKSAVWSNELTFRKQDIIERLNRRVGTRAVRDIIFKVGTVKPARESRRVEAEEGQAGLEGIPLSDEELEQVDAVARVAGDSELSESVRSLMSSALRLEKWKRARGWTPCTKCGALQQDTSALCPMCRTQHRHSPSR